jgi:1-acyl-sn-glycerol-3-phosphate acyltransferase
MMFLTKRDWRGAEKLETDGAGIIVVTNHISWFDPLTIALILWNSDRPPRFLAKESVFRVPVVGSVITSAGQIKVYRETANAVDAVRDAISAVEAGECVVVYPEGTITRDPDLWPMEGKTGAARIALATGRPVFPVAMWGPQEVMRPYRKEFRIFPRKTMRVRVGDPVDLSAFAGRELDADTLHAASDRIMDALTAELAEIRKESAPTHRFAMERKTTTDTTNTEGEQT